MAGEQFVQVLVRYLHLFWTETILQIYGNYAARYSAFADLFEALKFSSKTIRGASQKRKHGSVRFYIVVKEESELKSTCTCTYVYAIIYNTVMKKKCDKMVNK